jgi:hypothetical protein
MIGLHVFQVGIATLRAEVERWMEEANMHPGTGDVEPFEHC